MQAGWGNIEKYGQSSGGVVEMSRKTALVTGASRGIGAAIARKLAGEGFDLVVTCLEESGQIDQVAEDCRASGAEVLVLIGDCSSVDVCKGWVKEALGRFNRLDVLVNNAGITKDGLLMRMTDEQFDQVMQVNLYSAFYLCREVARPMMKQKSGRIISISSIAGVFGNAGQANYAASKAGLIGMARSLARELGSRNITANVVAPGFVDTDMTAGLSEDQKKAILGAVPLGRYADAAEVAGAVSFLAGEDAGYITGAVIPVDGGLGMGH
jgi:3-oxoacyl-[acyl-carrier protein] reductase